MFLMITVINYKFDLFLFRMDVGNLQQITAAQFGSRFKSKKEVFGFLTVELKAYLPSYHTVSIYFLKGKCLLLTMILCSDIIRISSISEVVF